MSWFLAHSGAMLSVLEALLVPHILKEKFAILLTATMPEHGWLSKLSGDAQRSIILQEYSLILWGKLRSSYSYPFHPNIGHLSQLPWFPSPHPFVGKEEFT